VLTAPEFIKHAYDELQLPIWGYRKENINGVAYKSWNDSNIDKTFFVETRDECGNMSYFLQVADGNPNGWNFRPYETKEISENMTDDTQQKEILRQTEAVYREFVPKTKNGIVVVEGKISNNSYKQKGPMIIDVYQGISQSENKSLGHARHIEAFLHR
jgi:hypothetical protein